MYKLVSTISNLVRAFILPNPFTKFFEAYFAETMLSESVVILANIFNLVLGSLIIHIICFGLVAIIYDRGESPAVGSILYLFFVIINSRIITLVSSGVNDSDFKKFFIRCTIGIILEIVILFGVRNLKNNIMYN